MKIPEQINRLRWKIHFNKLRDEILRGDIPTPWKATIELTMRCNLNCQMCFRDREQKGELALGEIKKIISHLPDEIEEIHLIGGEVFLRNDIIDILDYLKENKYHVRVHTNGTLLDDELASKLKRYDNLLGLGFSIDGTRDLHNKIRGSEKAFEKTVDAIRRTSKMFPLSVNTVLMDENFGQIEELFHVIRDLGIREYRLEPEMFSTPQEVESSDVKPIAANINESGAYGYSAKEMIELKKRLDLLAKDKGIRIVIAPRVAEIDSEEFINGRIRDRKRLFCKHLLVPRIDSRGNLVFCHIIKKRFGNLLKKDFNDLWRGKELTDFRRRLLGNNLFPVCIRCCRLRSI